MAAPKEFCINLIGRIGDMVLATALLRQIKIHFPDTSIDVIALPINSPVIKKHPAVRSILVWDRSLLRRLSVMASLRSKAYDLYLDPKDHRSSTSRLLGRVVMAAMRIGFNAPGRRKVLDISIPDNSLNLSLQMAVRNCRVLEPLGISLPDASVVKPWLVVSDDARKRIASRLPQQSATPMVLLNLSAGDDYRQPSIDQWIAIGRKVADECAMPLVCSAPREIKLALTLCSELGVPRIETETIDELAALIEAVDGVITPDTSVVHFASGFNKPIVALFPNVKWNAAAFAPMSDYQEVLYAPDDGLISDVPTISICDAVSRLVTHLRKEITSCRSNPPSQEPCDKARRKERF